MEAFVHTGSASRIVFGRGTLAGIAAEVAALGIERALVLATPSRIESARQICERLGSRSAGVFTEIAMHTPVALTERAMERVQAEGIDGVIAIGGGSTIGLGKAIALRTDLPQIALPTTYSGSEMTPILGETAKGKKTTQRTLKVLPETVIYDVDLTLSLPPDLSGTSGINAIAHAVEALYAKDRNPIVSLMAEEGIRALGRALPRVVDDPQDPAPRTRALYGAWLCGACLGQVSMALHHKLCHTLGGRFDLPHAQTHTVILPHAAAYNAAAAKEAMAVVAQALDADDAPRALFDLAARIEARQSLEALGMPQAGIAGAAELALENPYWNPRAIDEEGIRKLLERAWSGAPPEP
eukprot:XP_003391857.1 PREDICTED: uncharacterized protein LOC100638792 [Amphimedon queenslandica]